MKSTNTAMMIAAITAAILFSLAASPALACITDGDGRCEYVDPASFHTAAVTEPEPEAPQPQVKARASYIVQAGDTLYRIAGFFQVTVELLMLENRITDPTKLQIGQRLSIPTPDSEIASWLQDGNHAIEQTFHATLTAYTAGYESTGKSPGHPAYGITASGATVKENHTIAVDPKVIPLGSLVFIEGIGIRRAEDTGSAIKGAKIDVYIPQVREAIEFGVKRDVKVYVLRNT